MISNDDIKGNTYRINLFLRIDERNFGHEIPRKISGRSQSLNTMKATIKKENHKGVQYDNCFKRAQFIKKL